MTVHLDKVDNATVRQDAKGITAVRVAHLSNIGGRPDTVHADALSAAGLPRWGDTHPAFPTLRLLDIVLEAIDTRQWRGILTYREPSAEDRLFLAPLGTVAEVEWFSTQVTVDKLYDAEGNRMFHWYAGSPTSVLSVGGNIVETRMAGLRALAVKAERADVQIPSVGARVTMAEATNPRTRQAYIGATNRGYWSGDPPQTWLFVGLAGRFERDRWINTYELVYRQDTWDLESVIEYNGSPPSDATVGNGITYFRVYQSANYQQLGFEL